MMNEKDKLISLKEGLEIVKKYDVDSNLNYLDSMLSNDSDELERSLSEEELNELVHSNVVSYIDIEKTLKK